MGEKISLVSIFGPCLSSIHLCLSLVKGDTAGGEERGSMRQWTQVMLLGGLSGKVWQSRRERASLHAFRYQERPTLAEGL